MEGRDAVLMGGPWIISGQVLGLDRWSPEFSASSKMGFSTPIWVRLPGLPLYSWDSVSIASIVSVIGDPLWLDAPTDKIDRGVFARSCVRIDLSQPLKPGLWILGPYGRFYQQLEYEGLSSFCFSSGCVGHSEASCKLKVGNLKANASTVQSMVNSPEDCSSNPRGLSPPSEPNSATVNDPRKQGCDEDEGPRGRGPWMIVPSRKRPGRRSQPAAGVPAEHGEPSWKSDRQPATNIPNLEQKQFSFNASSQQHKGRPNPPPSGSGSIQRQEQENGTKNGVAGSHPSVGPVDSQLELHNKWAMLGEMTEQSRGKEVADQIVDGNAASPPREATGCQSRKKKSAAKHKGKDKLSKDFRERMVSSLGPVTVSDRHKKRK